MVDEPFILFGTGFGELIRHYTCSHPPPSTLVYFFYFSFISFLYFLLYAFVNSGSLASFPACQLGQTPLPSSFPSSKILFLFDFFPLTRGLAGPCVMYVGKFTVMCKVACFTSFVLRAHAAIFPFRPATHAPRFITKHAESLTAFSASYSHNGSSSGLF